MTIREKLDAYTKEKYGIEPEVLPFSHEEYEIYRHGDTGKWFAVFIVKDRKTFGLGGDGYVEVVSVKIKDRKRVDHLMEQPGYLYGYPSKNWKWTTVVLDEIVPFEDICKHLDESYIATSSGIRNKRTPLPKREIQ